MCVCVCMCVCVGGGCSVLVGGCAQVQAKVCKVASQTAHAIVYK